MVEQIAFAYWLWEAWMNSANGVRPVMKRAAERDGDEADRAGPS